MRVTSRLFHKREPSSIELEAGQVHEFIKARFNSFYIDEHGKSILCFDLRYPVFTKKETFQVPVKLYVHSFSRKRQTITKIKKLGLTYGSRCTVTGTVTETKIHHNPYECDEFQVWMQDDEKLLIEEA